MVVSGRNHVVILVIFLILCISFVNGLTLKGRGRLEASTNAETEGKVDHKSEFIGDMMKAVGGAAVNVGAGLADGTLMLPRARWGVPVFEDEACVICQYVVQRVQNEVLKELEAIDAKATGKKAGVLQSNTMDPFAPPAAPQPVPPQDAQSVTEMAGKTSNVPPLLHNSDLVFNPSLQYKKELMDTLKSRWMGKSILRNQWTKFVSKFCSTGELPEMYVPVCGMIYQNSKVLVSSVFFGFPFDQVCLMGKMCGPKSYFATPTAVHNPIMSMYYNNLRGEAGFTGGEKGRLDPPIKI